MGDCVGYWACTQFLCLPPLFLLFFFLRCWPENSGQVLFPLLCFIPSMHQPGISVFSLSLAATVAVSLLSPLPTKWKLLRLIRSHFDKHTALVLALTASTSTSMTIATPLHCCCEACEHGVPGPRLGRHPKESRHVQINAPYYGAMHHTMVLV